MVKRNKQKKSMKRWVLAGVLGLVCVVFVVAVLVYNKSEKVGFDDRGLPIINIELNGVDLDEINNNPKDVKYEGNELDLYEGDGVSRYNDVEIKGRGNSTWGMLKKSYQVKFDEKVELLGMGKVKKWVLSANYLDPSLMRNDVALTLADMLEEQYSHRGEFVELYIDGEYIGLYYLVQKIEIAKGSVDLRDDMGVLFEVDTLHQEQETCYMTYLGECLVLVDEVLRGSETGAKQFLAIFNQIEEAAMRGDYEKIEEGLDIESFAKYFLINEFTINPDAYSSSFYLYKDGVDDKIHAGPVWDFDLALGNRRWIWQVDERFFDLGENMIRKREAFGYDGLEEDHSISKLIYYMMEMPEFKKEVARIFQDKMSGRKMEFVGRIINKAEKINRAAAIDEAKWEKKNFETELAELVEWIKLRYDYFELEYGGDNLQIPQKWL